MRKVTRESNAARAAEAWAAGYPEDGPWGADERKQGITKILKDLGDNPDPDDVDRVIGNKSWTSVDECCECSCTKSSVLEIGGDDEQEAPPAYICFDCLLQGVNEMFQPASK